MATDIRFTDITDATTATDGTGHFDKLMKVFTLHIEEQYNSSRLTGADYATVYLGGMQSALATAAQFALEAPLKEVQITAEEARTATENAQTIQVAVQTIQLEAQTLQAEAQTIQVVAQTFQVEAQAATEAEKKLQLVAQTIQLTAQTATEDEKKLQLIAQTLQMEAQTIQLTAQTLTEDEKKLQVKAQTAKIVDDSAKVVEDTHNQEWHRSLAALKLQVDAQTSLHINKRLDKVPEFIDGVSSTPEDSATTAYDALVADVPVV